MPLVTIPIRPSPIQVLLMMIYPMNERSKKKKKPASNGVSNREPSLSMPTCHTQISTRPCNFHSFPTTPDARSFTHVYQSQPYKLRPTVSGQRLNLAPLQPPPLTCPRDPSNLYSPPSTNQQHPRLHSHLCPCNSHTLFHPSLYC